MEFWKSRSFYTVSSNREGWSEPADTFYMLVPLLCVALLIVIGLFLLWRCQLQKATRRQPAYTHNRFLTNNCSIRTLPHPLVPRENAVFGEVSHQESGLHPAAVINGPEGRCPRLDSQQNTLYVQDSLSVASWLSGATPPPSYDEVAGHMESSGDETTTPSYRDPPPKYEEIVKEK